MTVGSYTNKCIIAGSRSITDRKLCFELISHVHRLKPITHVICGEASGIDTIGKEWAIANGVKVISEPAPWDDVEGKPEHEIKTNTKGFKYWWKAGFFRNEVMAKKADNLILIWDGKSNGSKHMLGLGKKYKLGCAFFQVSVSPNLK